MEGRFARRKASSDLAHGLAADSQTTLRIKQMINRAFIS
jgi:hypothetical protein